MNESIRQLQPATLWNYFTDMNAIPRASKKEEKIIEFMVAFGKSLNLPVYTDPTGNVIIKKPASKGMENRETVVLQSHLDMVHQKNADTNFDFATQGIEMYIDNEWVKAKGTTLGADNGIGVAAIMTILASNDIPHPPVEALFTIDEETGMTGAKGLESGKLDGKVLLNLDTEDDDELTIGCAGGIDVTAEANYTPVAFDGGEVYTLALKGLTGGHSGVEIHLGRANANKLMNRALHSLCSNHTIGIVAVTGGSLRNAIPRESVATVMIKGNDASSITDAITKLAATFREEYAYTDPNLDLSISKGGNGNKVLPADFQAKLLNSIYACPNGIYRMVPGIEGLVQTSNNIAKVVIADGVVNMQCLTRGSVDSEKQDLADSIKASMELCGATVTYAGEYPGWAPRPDAPVIKLMEEIYAELFNEKLHVTAIHAGLECGIIGSKYPGMQMVSFGPTIKGPHSPDEKVNIASVQKFWNYLLALLKQFPERK